MKISVRIKPNSKSESVEKRPEGDFLVRVKAPAKEGKANEALIKILSKEFSVPKSRIAIISGLGSKNKIIEVL